jgi:hypothetical protein
VHITFAIHTSLTCGRSGQSSADGLADEDEADEYDDGSCWVFTNELNIQVSAL